MTTTIPHPQRRRFPLEAIGWAVALALLAMFATDLHGHWTICLPTLLGFEGCLGCGVGYAIGLFLRGDVVASFEAHPVGPFAVVVIVFRIAQLILPFSYFWRSSWPMSLPFFRTSTAKNSDTSRC